MKEYNKANISPSVSYADSSLIRGSLGVRQILANDPVSYGTNSPSSKNPSAATRSRHRAVSDMERKVSRGNLIAEELSSNAMKGFMMIARIKYCCTKHDELTIISYGKLIAAFLIPFFAVTMADFTV